MSEDIAAPSNAGLFTEAYMARGAIPRLNMLSQLPIGVSVRIQGLIKPGLLLVSHGSIHNARVRESEGPCQVSVMLDPLRG